jgi:hypothetical protein
MYFLFFLARVKEEPTMEEYVNYERKAGGRPGMNPIWRGIGCILTVVVPLISYALTTIFIPPIVATGMVPHELLGRVQFPAWAYTTPVVSSIAGYLGSIDNLWIKLIGFFIMISLLTGVFSLLYSIVYQLIGPPRYTDLDAPPSRHKPKVYKR